MRVPTHRRMPARAPAGVGTVKDQEPSNSAGARSAATSGTSGWPAALVRGLSHAGCLSASVVHRFELDQARVFLGERPFCLLQALNGFREILIQRLDISVLFRRRVP